MRLSALYEGEIKKGLGWLGKQIKKHGPKVAKTGIKTVSKALEKSGEIGTGAVTGAVKGAYEAATKEN